MKDVIIIGAGVVGCSIAYELSKYELNLVVLEKDSDVAEGTTKGNSAILHAGYDPEPNTLMARLNVEGSSIAATLCPQLSIPRKNIGSFVIALDEEQLSVIRKLKDRGEKNGVPNLQLLSAEETLNLEPNLNPQVKGALFAPTAAVSPPWAIAFAQMETAIKNGVKLFLDTEVTSISRVGERFEVVAGGTKYSADLIINAAGLYADKIHDMISKSSEFTIHPDIGEYFLMDKSQGKLLSRIIFQTPTALGKGVLVSPTPNGNLLVGPNSRPVKERDFLETTSEGLEYVKNAALKSVPTINFKETIRQFAGLRAHSSEEDFIIRPSSDVPNFINVAGIKSPGLTAAPAIAKYVLGIIENIGFILKQKATFVDRREKRPFNTLSLEEKNRKIQEDPAFGRIVCRCETVTEGEIRAILKSDPAPRTVDAVKRRTAVGFGRCQGGFCTPKLVAILSDFYNIPPEKVVLNSPKSFILSSGDAK